MTVPRWLPPTVWAALILVATSLPQSRLPDVGEFDKVGHACMYAVLALLTVRAAANGRRVWRLLAGVLIGISLFGALDELHQRFIPGRTADTHDWLADTIGAGLGCMASVVAFLRRERGSV